MGWAENRIHDYQRGGNASWLERRMLEHANPVHFPLAIAASVGIGYGLWKHRWDWIAASTALAFAGHAYCWTRPDMRARGRLLSPESERWPQPTHPEDISEQRVVSEDAGVR